MTLLQEQTQKHYLNQGSGSFTLRGLESKPGSEGVMVNLESTPDKHVKRPLSKAIRAWLDDVLICKLSAWDWTSAQSHIGMFVDIVFRALDVKPFCQLGYLRITDEPIRPGVFCSAVCWHTAFEEHGLFWSDSSFTPPFSLWHPFLSSLCLPTFLFIDSEISVEAAVGDQKGCYALASVCCLTLSVLSVLLPEVFLSSSQQMWRIRLGKEKTPDVALCCFYWLAPCSLCDVSQHSQSSSSTLRFNPSIDCDVKMTKCFWRFGLGDWILFFIVDEGVPLCFIVATELNLAHFCEDSVSFFHYCYLFLI